MAITTFENYITNTIIYNNLGKPNNDYLGVIVKSNSLINKIKILVPQVLTESIDKQGNEVEGVLTLYVKRQDGKIFAYICEKNKASINNDIVEYDTFLDFNATKYASEILCTPTFSYFYETVKENNSENESVDVDKFRKNNLFHFILKVDTSAYTDDVESLGASNDVIESILKKFQEINSLLDNKVSKSGDTMSGGLTLGGEDNNLAYFKAYGTSEFYNDFKIYEKNNSDNTYKAVFEIAQNNKVIKIGGDRTTTLGTTTIDNLTAGKSTFTKETIFNDNTAFVATTVFMNEAYFYNNASFLETNDSGILNKVNININDTAEVADKNWLLLVPKTATYFDTTKKTTIATIDYLHNNYDKNLATDIVIDDNKLKLSHDSQILTGQENAISVDWLNDVTFDKTTYTLTFTFKDARQPLIVDLPTESLIKNITYDGVNKKLICTLVNGKTVEVPLTDLVSSLQDQIDTLTNTVDELDSQVGDNESRIQDLRQYQMDASQYNSETYTRKVDFVTAEINY